MADQTSPFARLKAMPRTLERTAGMVNRGYVSRRDGQYVSSIFGPRRHPFVKVLVTRGWAQVDDASGCVRLTPAGQAALSLVQIGDLSPAMIRLVLVVQAGRHTRTPDALRFTMEALHRRKLVGHDGLAWRLTGHGTTAYVAIRLVYGDAADAWLAGQPA